MTDSTPSQRSPVPQQEIQRPATDSRADTLKAAEEAAAKKAREEEAANKAREEAAIQHAKFLERYLNAGFSRKPGTRSLAIIAASEDGKLNSAISTALAQHFRTDSVEIISSFFKPEFVSDKLFAEVFNGSTDVLKKLEVANSLDALLLSRQSVQYSTSPSLLDLITANMQLEVQVLPVTGTVQAGAWTFTANGAGFKRGEARAMAEERLIKQIANDTKMSIR